MLYGRKTYEMLYPYWSSFQNDEQGVANKLNHCKKYVVSSKLNAAPWGDTTILHNNFIEDITKIKKENGGYILVQGSSSLMKPPLEAGLVVELKLSRPKIKNNQSEFCFSKKPNKDDPEFGLAMNS